jgi:hypothetical protein
MTLVNMADKIEYIQFLHDASNASPPEGDAANN